jgi:hypothetical protein
MGNDFDQQRQRYEVLKNRTCRHEGGRRLEIGTLRGAAAIVRAAGTSVLAIAVLSSCGPFGGREDAELASASILPEGAASDLFGARAIGQPVQGNEKPQISNVGVVDLDGDGLLDVLVCDAQRNQVAWIRQHPKDVYTEQVLAGDIQAPGHVEAFDFDRDGDQDLLVAGLGALFPSNLSIGSVTILEHTGKSVFVRHTVAEGLPRVADVRAGDLDGDGDADLTVAAFGYDHGQTLWLEQVAPWVFEPHVLQRLSGAINALVVDITGDGRLDIVTLVSQEWAQIWVFQNGGRGVFTERLLWGSSNSDFGSSWLALADLDRDRDQDILFSNGDAFDYAPANTRPWHGVQWLENEGDLKFELHRIGEISGASSPSAADLDRDGDVDVALVSAYNRWETPAARSLVWLENNGRQQFSMRPVASSPTHLITLAIGDLDGDGSPDLVTGGMHISGPYDRMSRVTLWSNRAASAR